MHIAMVPELAIPRHTVPQLLAMMQASATSLVFFGGVEGLTRQQYTTLLGGVGQSQPLHDGPDAYVNSALILIKTPERFIATVRAKCVASRAENEAAPMATGSGPFVTIRLGNPALTVVPLICSEFVWPEGLWQKLTAEVPNPIDIVPVIQQSKDTEAQHTGPQLHYAYTHGAHTDRIRFLFVNQAMSSECDGMCNVVVPPTSPRGPAFDHVYRELWHLPGAANYRGFGIPDRTGCIWSADLVTTNAGASALGNRICSGKVEEVLSPAGAALNGLCVGLMRTAAMAQRQELQSGEMTETTNAAATALHQGAPEYILRELVTAAANDVFFRIICAEAPTWANVASIVHELVEGAKLLATGGDDVRLIPCDGGNCSLLGRTVSILYAPNADAALTAHFPRSQMFDVSAIPAGVLLICVVATPANVDATKVGDVLRADRVTSTSAQLADIPMKTEESSVTIRLDDVEFRSTHQLRQNLAQPSTAAARTRIESLFPKVYA
ncbi:MAG: hypothetical protein ACTS6J_25255 [Burkholderiales bacterium]